MPAVVRLGVHAVELTHARGKVGVRPQAGSRGHQDDVLRTHLDNIGWRTLLPIL